MSTGQSTGARANSERGRPAVRDSPLLKSGFARLRCRSCGSEHLLAFSCQTRNFCPSCQAKRAALFAERVRNEIALPVPHRHITFTIPKALRGLFERDRRLLSILSRSAYEALRRTYAAAFGSKGSWTNRARDDRA